MAEPIPEPEVGSALYYVKQMIDRLREHGEYRVRWEWAYRELTETSKRSENQTP